MLYPIGKFANLIWVTTQTLRNWDTSNYLKPVYVSKGGRRYCYDEQLNEILQIRKQSKVVRVNVGLC